MKLALPTFFLFLFVTLFSCFTFSAEETVEQQLKTIASLVVSQPEKAIIALNSLEKQHTQLTVEQQVSVIKERAMANVYLNNHSTALTIMKDVQLIAENENNNYFRWLYHNNNAVIYWHMDRIEKSLTANLSAFNVVKDIDSFKKYQSISAGNIGYAFIKLGFPEKAIPHLESALEIGLIQGNPVFTASSYNNLGEANLALKNFQQAKFMLDKALAIRLEHKLTFHSSFSYHNIGLLHYEQQDYIKAKAALSKAISIRESIGFVKGLLVSQIALVKVHLQLNEPSLAQTLAERIVVKAEKQQNDTSLSQGYSLLKKIYAAKGDYKKAYNASVLYEKSLEKVVSSKTSAVLADYLNSSESIAKDLNILTLKKNAEIQALQVAGERQKNIILFISGFCIVSVLVTFLWTLQRSRQQIALSNTELSKTLSQLKHTQEKLIKSEKMSALTTLVSGMAHQINTPLGIAVTGVSHIHEKVKKFTEVIARGRVKKAEVNSLIAELNTGSELAGKSMDKVAELINQFKLISASLQAESQQEFELCELLTKQADLIIMQLTDTKPVIKVSGNETLMKGYPEAINKVFNQLISNSVDHAFANTSAPEIAIEVIKDNNHVEIYYQDNGSGIDAGMASKVFEPFYTTRLGNDNLGIGLSIVYNLVVQLMQGSISCQSKQEDGVMFCISLPLVTEADVT